MPLPSTFLRRISTNKYGGGTHHILFSMVIPNLVTFLEEWRIKIPVKRSSSYTVKFFSLSGLIVQLPKLLCAALLCCVRRLTVNGGVPQSRDFSQRRQQIHCLNSALVKLKYCNIKMSKYYWNIQLYMYWIPIQICKMPSTNEYTVIKHKIQIYCG